MREPQCSRAARKSSETVAGVTFDGLLAASDRDAALRSLGSADPSTTSWEGAVAEGDSPALLRVTPRNPDCLTELARVLGGSGRPLGVTNARRDGNAIFVAFDPRVSSLAMLTAVVDAVLEPHPRDVPVAHLPLDDATLVAVARELLSEPDLETSRLIEAYLEPMLAGALS